MMGKWGWTVGVLFVVVGVFQEGKLVNQLADVS